MYRWLGCALEGEFPPVKAENSPVADAIVVMGGGMGVNTNVYSYAEMWGGADRAWHAARLYKAGKAPIVIPTGSGERESTVPLLIDLCVPESAILVEDKARNTEENAKFVARMIGGHVSRRQCEEDRNADGRKYRVLLVTSAWHMKRSKLMYEKYAPELEIIPAAADYEALVIMGHPFCSSDLLPDVNKLASNSALFKECLGYWGYRLFRR